MDTACQSTVQAGGGGVVLWGMYFCITLSIEGGKKKKDNIDDLRSSFSYMTFWYHIKHHAVSLEIFRTKGL